MLVSKLCDRAVDFKGLSPSTAYGWRHSIKSFATEDVSSIDRDFAFDHRCELNKQGYKPGYVRTRLGYLASMWEVAYERRWVDVNPWRGLLKGLEKGRKRYPHKIFQHFSAFHEDPLFMGLWLHGCRVSELANVLPGDFVLDAEVPYINIEHNHIRKCKNDYTQRHVPIHPSFHRFIHKWVFDSNAGAGDNFSRRLKKATGISAHGIRHNFITRMRQAGVEYSVAMAIVGHKPTGMTASYGDVLLTDMLKELSKL